MIRRGRVPVRRPDPIREELQRLPSLRLTIDNDSKTSMQSADLSRQPLVISIPMGRNKHAWKLSVAN
jgi:hypothetical protein